MVIWFLISENSKYFTMCAQSVNRRLSLWSHKHNRTSLFPTDSPLVSINWNKAHSSYPRTSSHRFNLIVGLICVRCNPKQPRKETTISGGVGVKNTHHSLFSNLPNTDPSTHELDLTVMNSRYITLDWDSHTWVSPLLGTTSFPLTRMWLGAVGLSTSVKLTNTQVALHKL